MSPLPADTQQHLFPPSLNKEAHQTRQQSLHTNNHSTGTNSQRRKQCSHYRFSAPLQLIILLLLISACQFAQAQLRTISLLDITPALYLSARADFGNPMTNRVVANLMFPPPDYEDLCELPPIYQSNNNNNSIDINRLPVDRETPIALLVRRDACSPQRKAEVALQIQHFTRGQLKYLIVYSDDPTDEDVLYRLQPTSRDDLKKLDSIGILYIPFRYAASIGFRMRTRAVLTGASPILYDNMTTTTSTVDTSSNSSSNNGLILREHDMDSVNANDANVYDWRLYAEFEPYDYDSENQGGYDYGSYHGSDGYAQTARFYWLRFVLFTSLIASPCLRAGYLWWSGGGRLHWRRNERGRIVGLQYIPPMPYWLIAGRGTPPPQRHPTTSTLTADQFATLPEIIYKKSASKKYVDDDDDDNNNTMTIDVESGNASQVTPVVKKTSLTNRVASNGEAISNSFTASSSSTSSSESVTKVVMEHESNDSADSNDYTTTCTTCSICIDDFEPSERLTFLPKCKHAFHKDCLLPWLTERQGCCPLCKTQVIDGLVNNDEDNNNNGNINGDDNNSEGNNGNALSVDGNDTEAAQAGTISIGEEPSPLQNTYTIDELRRNHNALIGHEARETNNNGPSGNGVMSITAGSLEPNTGLFRRVGVATTGSNPIDVDTACDPVDVDTICDSVDFNTTNSVLKTDNTHITDDNDRTTASDDSLNFNENVNTDFVSNDDIVDEIKESDVEKDKVITTTATRIKDEDELKDNEDSLDV